MPKKASTPSASNGAYTIGLDIGYGVTKAVSASQTVVFPSVWARAQDVKFMTAATAANYSGDDISDDEGSWIAGEKAQKHASVGSLRNLRGRTADENTLGNVARVRLAKVALGKLFPNYRNGEVVHIRIATGLPVDHMPGASGLKAALIGQHRIKTDATDFVANVTEVFVMPQPYGSVYREMLTETGKLNPCHTYTRTGVVDVGTYTVDLTLDDDGEYIDSLSGTVEAGMFKVQQAIAGVYERRFNQKPPYADVETIIKSGCVRVSGKLENFKEELAEALDDLRAAVLNLMGNLWQAGATVDVIYVSGGGASLVFDAIKSAYPQAQLTDDSQLANAQGYFNYAMFAAQPA